MFFNFLFQNAHLANPWDASTMILLTQTRVPCFRE